MLVINIFDAIFERGKVFVRISLLDLLKSVIYVIHSTRI